MTRSKLPWACMMSSHSSRTAPRPPRLPVTKWACWRTKLGASGTATANPTRLITGRAAPSVAHRVRGLGIDHYYEGVHDKRTAFADLLAKTGIAAEDCAYIGDDVIDLPVMSRVGLAVAVPDAPSFVRQHAHFVTGNRGGRGAVRELCELIMQAQGSFDRVMASYLE